MERIGPTGKFPDGKLSDEDDGELLIGVTHEDGRVLLSFGTPITWCSMPATTAKHLASLLIQHANALESN